MNLSERDTRLAEVMDDPGCDPVRLRRTLERFAPLNRAVSCWGGVYRTRLRSLLRGLDRPARVLDIGCGGGDVLRRLLVRAQRDGFEVEGVGIDPDPRAIAVARRAFPVPGISYREVGSRALVDEGSRFDVVISNHLLHHLDDREFDALIADSEALAEHAVLHSDIARGRAAYAAYAVGSAPISPGTFLRVDGLRSIRRSYTPRELAARLPASWWVERPGAFRVLAVRS